MVKNGVKAIIWDFDDTIVKSLEMGLRKKRKIVEIITGRNADEFPALRNLESHIPEFRKWKIWKDFYANTLGLTQEQVEEVGRLWEDPKLDETLIEMYEGINQVIITLKGYPQGIFSTNAKEIIRRSLEEAHLLEHFDCIVGYEESGKSKPAPDGLMVCIEKLTGSEPGSYVYIGDHKSDAEAAANANKHFEQNALDMRIVAIAALYGFPFEDYSKWKNKPNEVARKPMDIVDAVKRLELGYATTNGGVVVQN